MYRVLAAEEAAWLRCATSCFLTHHHYDHIADYGHFALARWDQSGIPTPLDVFGPPNTERITALLFGAYGVYAGDIRARTAHPMSQRIYASRGGTPPRPRPEVRAHDVGHGLVCEAPRWRMLAGPATHAEPFLTCYSYRLEAPERTIVFSGDSGDCPALAAFARGADTLIHMCSLRDAELDREGLAASIGGPRAAAVAVRAAGVRKLVLTHVQVPAWDTPEGLTEVVAAVRRHGP
jgi:ribonuclease BN (tRNA processing enzyme)